VEVEATFSWTEDRKLVANGKQTSRISLTCQRCQGILHRQLASEFCLVFVAGEAEAEELPDEHDPVIIGESEDIHVVDFIEDELMFPVSSNNRLKHTTLLKGWMICLRTNQERLMAVQKHKVTRSRRGMRRSHDKLKSPALSTDPTTGEVHLRHHVSPEGYYR